MVARRLYATDAIVLSRFDLGEADRVVTFLTPDRGKFKAIARGVRRPTSRLGGALEPFAELRVNLARGRTFEVVTGVALVRAFLRLRDSLEATATAWYLGELAKRTVEEREPVPAVFALLHRGYELLDAGMAPGRVARWFELHLADELGQGPQTDRCVECGRALLLEEAVRWVPPLGGVLGECCPGPPADRTGLSANAVKLLRAYRRLDVETLARLRVPPAVEAEVERAMRDFVRFALEREPRSLAFLDAVRDPSHR